MKKRNSPDSEDRRQVQRYRVSLAVELEHGQGRTRDVSTAGVFFETEQTFSVGQPIRLTLVFEYADPCGPLRVQCEGVVVRVEPCDGRLGVAVAFTPPGE